MSFASNILNLDSPASEFKSVILLLFKINVSILFKYCAPSKEAILLLSAVTSLIESSSACETSDVVLGLFKVAFIAFAKFSSVKISLIGVG